MPPSEREQPAGEMPRISIVMPVYNAADFLDAAVESVFSQTISEWELILVDDGSKDDSLHRCERYAQSCSRVLVVSQNNRGPSAARNAGVRVARGEFVFFLDADDYLPLQALENLLSVAETRRADIVLGNFLKQENDAPPVPQPALFSREGAAFEGDIAILEDGDLVEYVRHFLSYPSNHLVSYCWARLYRRSLIVEHALSADEDMRLFEDFGFNLAFLGKAQRLVFVNRPCYVYVLRGGHASASMSILDASRLAADMQRFREIVDVFLKNLQTSELMAVRIRGEVGHTLVHYALIFIIRTCRQITPENRGRVFDELRRFVAAPVLRESLPYYCPRPGNSRLLPLLIRLKLVRLLAVIAQARGNRRYGKMKSGAA